MNDLVTIYQADILSNYSISINIRSNSTIANAGCVSFNYTATFDGNAFQSNTFLLLNLLTISYILAETKRYYYFNLNSFPASVESFGYKTDVIYSAFYLYSNALK